MALLSKYFGPVIHWCVLSPACSLSLSLTHNVYVYVSVSFSLLMQAHPHLSFLSSKKGNNNTLECLWGLTALTNNSKNVFLCLFRDQFVRQTCAFGRSIVGQERKISIYTYVYDWHDKGNMFQNIKVWQLLFIFELNQPRMHYENQ